MKALFCNSPKDVQIDDKPLSNIQNPEDVILRVASTAISGSDLIFITELYLGCNQDKCWDMNLWEL
jgi:threonine dehydrogenase-like Zn-dependent dehydrogenase